MNLPPESPFGNTEYKWKLIDVDDKRFTGLCFQLSSRIRMGDGEAFYKIGVKDDGVISPLEPSEYSDSINVLKRMATSLKCDFEEVETHNLDNLFYGIFRFTTQNILSYQDIRVVALGNVNSGKSTTLATLISGKLDDGNIRSLVATHAHEIISKRTSDVSYRYLGFDEQGCVNHRLHSYKAKQIISQSKKIINLIDLPGHRMYMRSTLKGIINNHPDWAMVVVDSSSPLTESHTTEEHLRILDFYEIPFFIVMTKIDSSTDEISKQVTSSLVKMIKKINNTFTFIKITDFPLNISRNVIPVIPLSNRNGKNLELLVKFFESMNATDRRPNFMDIPGHSLIQVSKIYNHPNAGIVLSGLVNSGHFYRGDKVKLGPDYNGNFIDLTVKQIQSNYDVLSKAVRENHVAVSFSRFPDDFIPRSGMVLFKDDLNYLAKSIWKIKVRMVSLNYRISVGTCPNGYIGHCKVIFNVKNLQNDPEPFQMEEEKILEVGTSRPVFAIPGVKVIFFEGRLVAVGQVIE